MLERLDPPALRRWARTALADLTDRCEDIDRSNVFPVADGDTGTNLLLTLEAALAAVAVSGDDAAPAEVAAAFAQGALLGACGSSGTILAQLWRGWAQVLGERAAPGPVGVDHLTVAAALRRGADQAYAAVGTPVEGTMLTVARAAADGAAGSTLAAVVTGATRAARDALERTPEQLDVLARAGVVDAGGQGLLVLLEALAATVTGERSVRRPRPRPPHVLAAADPGAAPPGPAYEVTYLLDSAEPAVVGLRAALAVLGEAVVVVGGDPLWTVHVHTDDVGAAIEAGIVAGRPHRVRVTALAAPPPEWAPEPGGDVGSAPEAPAGARCPAAPGAGVGLLATVDGAGLAGVLAAHGVVGVDRHGRRPTTTQLLRALDGVPTRTAVLLADDPGVLVVARAAGRVARAQGRDVAVLPTRAAVQVLAAVAVHDADAPRGDDLVRMAAAAATTRTGVVEVAATAALTSAGPCRAGQVLGLVEGEVVEVGDDPAAVALSVATRMLAAGGELLTLVWGSRPGSQEVAVSVREVCGRHGGVEVDLVDGGQPGVLLLGVE